MLGTPGPATVRVSMSVLLRVRHDERVVLFHSPARPGSFGPPGGAVKYFAPADAILEELEFQRERTPPRSGVDQNDLRGFVPARQLQRFLRWFASGAYRESALECLVREIREELHEVGLGRLDAALDTLRCRPVREVTEGPRRVPGEGYKQYRRFQVHDLVVADAAALHLVRELVAAGESEQTPLVLATSEEQIVRGRQGNALIAPHTALLIRSERIFPDIAALR
jgi:hypothetical protein